MQRLPFTPGTYPSPWWLPEGHAQTVFGGVLRGAARVTFDTERWTMPDGEVIRADRSRPITPTHDATPTVLLLHGLEGSCDSPYVRGMTLAVLRSGWFADAVCFRGCGDFPLTTEKTYHAGFTDDLQECVRRIGLERPSSPLLLVGYSLGGNVMLKMLGSVWRDSPPSHVVAACTISSPFDLEQCAVSLDGRHPMAIIYRERFLRDMRAKVRSYRKKFPGKIDDVDVDALNSFKSFDHVISARATGDGTAENYWRNQSGRRFLDDIRVPTLLVNAKDDPLVPGHSIPVDQIARNPYLHLSVHKRGGHISFAYGSPTRPRNFSEEEAIRFFGCALQNRVVEKRPLAIVDA